MSTKKTVRGSFDHCSADGMAVVRWKDNTFVTMLSNDKGVFPSQKVLHYNKEMKKMEVECPLVVMEYNAYMGGTDKSYMLACSLV